MEAVSLSLGEVSSRLTAVLFLVLFTLAGSLFHAAQAAAQSETDTARVSLRIGKTVGVTVSGVQQLSGREVRVEVKNRATEAVTELGPFYTDGEGKADADLSGAMTGGGVFLIKARDAASGVESATMSLAISLVELVLDPLAMAQGQTAHARATLSAENFADRNLTFVIRDGNDAEIETLPMTTNSAGMAEIDFGANLPVGAYSVQVVDADSGARSAPTRFYVAGFEVTLDAQNISPSNPNAVEWTSTHANITANGAVGPLEIRIRDAEGNIVESHPASEWEQYFGDGTPDRSGRARIGLQLFAPGAYSVTVADTFLNVESEPVILNVVETTVTVTLSRSPIEVSQFGAGDGSSGGGGGGLTFVDATAKAEVAADAAFDAGSGDFSVVTFFKSSVPPPDHHVVFSNQNAQHPSTLELYVDINAADMRVVAGNPLSSQVFNHGGAPFDGQWHSVIITRQNGLLTAYYDGVNIGSGMAGGDGQHGQLSFGHLWGENHAQTLIGSLKNYSYWNRALSAQEAAAIASSGGQLAGNESGLVAYWPMDDGNGATLREVVAGRDAVLSGNYQWQSGGAGNGLVEVKATSGSSEGKAFVLVVDGTQWVITPQPAVVGQDDVMAMSATQDGVTGMGAWITKADFDLLWEIFSMTLAQSDTVTARQMLSAMFDEPNLTPPPLVAQLVTEGLPLLRVTVTDWDWMAAVEELIINGQTVDTSGWYPEDWEELLTQPHVQEMVLVLTENQEVVVERTIRAVMSDTGAEWHGVNTGSVDVVFFPMQEIAEVFASVSSTLTHHNESGIRGSCDSYPEWTLAEATLWVVNVGSVTVKDWRTGATAKTVRDLETGEIVEMGELITGVGAPLTFMAFYYPPEAPRWADGAPTWTMSSPLENGESETVTVGESGNPVLHCQSPDVPEIHTMTTTCGDTPLDLRMLVIKPHFIAHRTGGRFGIPVTVEELQGDPKNFLILVNDDAEVNTERLDFENETAAIANNMPLMREDNTPVDDDLVHVILTKLPDYVINLQRGVVELQVSNPQSVRLFSSDGTVLFDGSSSPDALSLDLSDTSSNPYFAELLTGDVSVWLEGMKKDANFKLSLVVKEVTGSQNVVVARTDMPILIAKWSFRNGHGEQIYFSMPMWKEAIVAAAQLQAEIGSEMTLSAAARAIAWRTEIDGLPSSSVTSLKVESLSEATDWFEDEIVADDKKAASRYLTMFYSSAHIYQADPDMPATTEERTYIREYLGLNIIHNDGKETTVTTGEQENPRDIHNRKLSVLNGTFSLEGDVLREANDRIRGSFSAGGNNSFITKLMIDERVVIRTSDGQEKKVSGATTEFDFEAKTRGLVNITISYKMRGPLLDSAIFLDAAVYVLPKNKDRENWLQTWQGKAWKSLRVDAAGQADEGGMVPGNPINRNRRISELYAAAYNDDPDVLKYCGMAAFASSEVGTSMADAMALEAQAGRAIGVSPKRVVELLSDGNFAIYMDIYPQVLAYTTSGIQELRAMATNERNELAAGALAAWEIINQGKGPPYNDALIRAGTEDLIKYEQGPVLQPAAFWDGPFWTRATNAPFASKLAPPGAPGGTPFHQWRKSTTGVDPKTSIHVLPTRLKWILENQVPAWWNWSSNNTVIDMGKLRRGEYHQ